MIISYLGTLKNFLKRKKYKFTKVHTIFKYVINLALMIGKFPKILPEGDGIYEDLLVRRDLATFQYTQGNSPFSQN